MRDYPLRITFTKALAVLMVYICTVLPLLGLLSLPIRILAGHVDQDTLVESFTMLGILGYCQLILIPYINQFNLIEVTPQGIRLRSFNYRFRWISLDWEELISVDQAEIPLFNNGTVWLITVKGLPVWYKLLGWRYRKRWEPGIVLMPELRNRAEVIDAINDKIAERHQNST